MSLPTLVTAAVKFFRGANLGPQPLSNMGTSTSPLAHNSLVQPDSSNGSMDDSAMDSAILAANDMIRLLQALLDLVTKAPSNPELAKSIKVVHSQLKDLVFSVTMAGEGSHLPEKEIFGPNQLTWLETAV